MRLIMLVEWFKNRVKDLVNMLNITAQSFNLFYYWLVPKEERGITRVIFLFCCVCLGVSCISFGYPLLETLVFSITGSLIVILGHYGITKLLRGE